MRYARVNEGPSPISATSPKRKLDPIPSGLMQLKSKRTCPSQPQPNEEGGLAKTSNAGPPQTTRAEAGSITAGSSYWLGPQQGPGPAAAPGTRGLAPDLHTVVLEWGEPLAAWIACGCPRTPENCPRSWAPFRSSCHGPGRWTRRLRLRRWRASNAILGSLCQFSAQAVLRRNTACQ